MYVTGESVVKAEILWAIKSVMSHFSFRVSSDIRGLFQNMFPDTAIAKNFASGKTKINYLICLALHHISERNCYKRSKKQSA